MREFFDLIVARFRRRPSAKTATIEVHVRANTHGVEDKLRELTQLVEVLDERMASVTCRQFGAMIRQTGLERSMSAFEQRLDHSAQSARELTELYRPVVKFSSAEPIDTLALEARIRRSTQTASVSLKGSRVSGASKQRAPIE